MRLLSVRLRYVMPKVICCVPNPNVYIYSAVQCTKVAIQLIGQPIERGQFQFQFRKTKAENCYPVDNPAISTSYSTDQYSTVLGLVKIFVGG